MFDTPIYRYSTLMDSKISLMASQASDFIRSMGWEIILSVFTGLIAIALFGAYLAIRLVAHFPRPERSSERQYLTTDVDGVTDERQLGSYDDDAEVFMSVIVPAYNEELRMTQMLDEAVDFLREQYGSGNSIGLVLQHEQQQQQQQSDAEKSETSTAAMATPSKKNKKKGGKAKAKANGSVNGSTNGSTNGSVSGSPQVEPSRWEILIVDDGSSDDTTGVAMRWARERIAMGHMAAGDLRVCHLEKNRGKGGAVTHGMRHIRGEYAVFADADGATKFSDLGPLLSELQAIQTFDHNPHGVAIGSRAHMVNTSAVVQRSFLRNFLMHGFHLFLRVMGISSIRDTQCGFKLFTRNSARHIFGNMHNEGWIFDIEVLLIAAMKGIPVVEVPVTWHEVEGTKMNLVRDSIRMAWDLCVMRGAYFFGVYAVKDR